MIVLALSLTEGRIQEIDDNVKKCQSFKEGEKTFLDLSLHVDPDQKLMGFILDRNTSSRQGLRKSVW